MWTLAKNRKLEEDREKALEILRSSYCHLCQETECRRLRSVSAFAGILARFSLSPFEAIVCQLDQSDWAYGAKEDEEEIAHESRV
jgi:hypothetical protein